MCLDAAPFPKKFLFYFWNFWNSSQDQDGKCQRKFTVTPNDHLLHYAAEQPEQADTQAAEKAGEKKN